MAQLGDLTLARFVPRVALDWVVDRPDELWRRVDGTMVFADISGFTALSERLATRGRIGAASAAAHRGAYGMPSSAPRPTAPPK